MGGQDSEFQRPITGSFTAASQSLDISSPNQETTVVQTSGTWVGNLVVEGSNDGTTYYPVLFANTSNFLPASTITANGTYIVQGGGYQNLRLRSSAWTSGTATISVYGSDATSLSASVSVLRGGTDGTIIGNSADSLKVTALQSGTWTTNTSNPDSIVTGTITAADAVVAAPAGDGSLRSGTSTAGSYVSITSSGGDSAWVVQLTGTISGNYYFEGSFDSTNGVDGNWITLNGRQTGTTTTVITPRATTAGIYRGNIAAFSWFRVRNTGGVSLNTSVKIELSAGTGAVFLNSALPNGTNNIGYTTTTFMPGTVDVYGSLSASSRHNQIQLNFAYTPLGATLSSYVNLATTGSGANALNSNGSASFSTGTSGTGFSKAQSPVTVIFQEGAEVFCTNSIAFTTPTSASSYQRSGIYDSANGFFVGYNGTSFGVTYRKAGVDTFTPQASFNQDTLLGSITSLFTRNGVPEALVPSNLNLYRIRYGWYGTAPIFFETLSADGNWVIFHKILYPNSSANPHIATPNLPVTIEVNTSGADATNVTINAGSMTAGVLDIKVPDTIIQPVNLGTLNAQVAVPMAGLQSAGFQINAGTFIGTLTPQASMDGGASWINTDFYDPNSATAFPTLTFTSANTAKTLGVLGFPGASHIRVLVTAYTSGTAAALIRAAMAPANLISLGGAYNSTLPTLATGQSTQLQTDSNGRLLTSSVSLPTTASKFSFGSTTTSTNTQVAVRSTTYTEVTTNSTMTLLSSSANDTAAGTGARSVTVTYLDQNMAGPFTATVNLNGTTAVNVTSGMCYIEKIAISSVGSGLTNAGTITLRTGGGATVGTIAVGANTTFWAHHYIPQGKVSYISGFSVGNNGTTSGQTTTIVLKVSTPTVANTPENQISDFISAAGSANSVTRNYNSPIQVTGPARVTAFATPGATSTYTHYASFDYIDN